MGLEKLLMLLNFTDSTALVAQSFRWIISAQFLDESTGIAGDVPGELNGVDTLQDDVVGTHWIGSGEGRST